MDMQEVVARWPNDSGGYRCSHVMTRGEAKYYLLPTKTVYEHFNTPLGVPLPPDTTAEVVPAGPWMRACAAFGRPPRR